MEKIIEKMSNYHVFNYMTPGIIMMILCNDYFKIENKSIIYIIFMSYFIGIVISRFSSLLIEKIICYIFKLEKQPYDKYISASANDSKIEIIMQDSNMYRNLCTMLLIVIIIKLSKVLNINLMVFKEKVEIIVLFGLIILFAFSYIKQCKYAISRIKINNNEKEK